KQLRHTRLLPMDSENYPHIHTCAALGQALFNCPTARQSLRLGPAQAPAYVVTPLASSRALSAKMMPRPPHIAPPLVRRLLYCSSGSRNRYPSPQIRSDTMLGTILIVLLVLALLGALPAWPYSQGWGYAPTGGI